MSNDPYWDNTVLALRFDGVHGSTVFTDLKGHAVTSGSSAIISTARSRFGGASADLTATYSYLAVAASPEWAMGTEDFSVDFYCFFITQPWPNDDSSVLLLGNNVWIDALGIAYNSNLKALKIGIYGLGNGYKFNLPIPLELNWHHIAVARVSGVFSCYLDGQPLAGIQIGSGIPASKSLVTGGPLTIGGNNNLRGLFGYLDNLRIVKGVSAFNDPFTPPAAFFGYRVSGTVKDTAGSFAARIVRAYNRTNGNLVGQAVSSALDGSFDIALVTPDPHTVICLDDDSGDELEALIYDRVMPVL